MSLIHSKDTKPELKVRKWLHGQGYRFRVNVRVLPGSPDIVLAKYRTCIFVNGCFWHGHDGCQHYTHPKTNPSFWEEKVKRNKMRDQIVEAKLEAAGWNVVTIWECELKKDSFDNTMEQLTTSLLHNREKWLDGIEKRKAERERIKAEKAAKAARDKVLLTGMDIPPRIQKLSAQED